MKPVYELTPEEAMDLVEREAANAGVTPPNANAQMRAIVLSQLQANPKTIPHFVAAHREKVRTYL